MENKEEEQFSLPSSLISKRDIFTILSEYLTVKEIVGLDNVFCSKEFRDDFLYSLQSITISLPQSTELIKGCVEWCCRRHIFESRGILTMYGWNWMDLSQGDLSNDYRSFLNRVKHLVHGYLRIHQYNRYLHLQGLMHLLLRPIHYFHVHPSRQCMLTPHQSCQCPSSIQI